MVTRKTHKNRCKVCGRFVYTREYFGLEGGEYMEYHECAELDRWIKKHPRGNFLRRIK
jgi:hypothetical protein